MAGKPRSSLRGRATDRAITIIGPPGSFISPGGPMNFYLCGPLFSLFFLALRIALSLEEQPAADHRPGATRRRERIGRRNLNELARRTMARHNGDRTYQRHDGLGVAAALAAPVSDAAAAPIDCSSDPVV
jgi:hypothetical protein